MPRATTDRRRRFLASFGAIGVLAILGACETTKESRTDERSKKLYVDLLNRSDRPLRAFVDADPRAAGGADPERGNELLIEPGDRTRVYPVPPELVDKAGELIIHLDVSLIGPTWETARTRKYEILSPLPAKLTVTREFGLPSVVIEKGAIALMPE